MDQGLVNAIMPSYGSDNIGFDVGACVGHTNILDRIHVLLACQMY